MTTSPFPWTASGDYLLDARGNVIAQFKDYRDADKCVEALEYLRKLEREKRFANLEDDPE